MRVLFVIGALLVALIGTVTAEGINDDTINIDEVETLGAAVDDPQALEGSGNEAVNIGDPTTGDDEDLITELVDGSGGAANVVDPDMSYTTVSSKITTSNNRIPENPMRPKSTVSNAIGPIYNEENGRNSNDALVNYGTTDVEEKEKNFFEKMFGNPAILAGMVGAVVLILLTVVLLFLFVIYRIKKKDEGSYSLDEPHKVKDPTAYWKDTKEFYA